MLINALVTFIINRMKKYKIIGSKGMSMPEILVVIVGIAVVSGGAYTLFSGTIKTSGQGTKMMESQQNAQKIIMRITRDLKDANYIEADAPKFINADETATVELPSGKNFNEEPFKNLVIVKQTPNFTDKPSGADKNKHILWTPETITYSLKPMPAPDDKKFNLTRKLTSSDSSKNSEEIVGSNISVLRFYRIMPSAVSSSDPSKNVYGAGAQTVYIYLKLLTAPLSGEAAAGAPDKGFAMEIRTAVSARGVKLN
ncbi:MAG: hypothetical protein QMC67_17560 [Candidatus Wallbacteria bacterium]